MRSVGTPEQLEDRRRKAIALLRQGHRVNETARIVGVTPGAITQWRQAYEQQGEDFFQAHSPPGRMPGLSEKQTSRLKNLLLRGANKNGYPTEVWTLRRIAELIKKHFGMTYDPSSVWHILQRMGWSYQKPENRAHEQEQETVVGWHQKDWPHIKKAQRTGKTIVFPDESGFTLQPTERRTLAPKGRIPHPEQLESQGLPVGDLGVESLT